MADSVFWRDLAAQFRALPYPDMLRAEGQYIVGSGSPWNWQLRGGPNEFTDSAFEALARRGASEIASAGATDLLVFWLEELRKGSFNFRSSSIATEINPDGTDGRQYLMGTIYAVCDASAILCKKLEADAVQAEFDEKHRRDAPPEKSKSDSEVTHRQKLLADYKAATGNPSNKRIYEARNSGIHKPEFYEWLRGSLPANSTPTISFERFLREQRPPIPRKPKV
jgi:hypothetical protein